MNTLIGSFLVIDPKVLSTIHSDVDASSSSVLKERNSRYESRIAIKIIPAPLRYQIQFS